MWQLCAYIPTTLPKDPGDNKIPLQAAKLGTSFVLETMIHAKEKVEIPLINVFTVFFIL